MGHEMKKKLFVLQYPPDFDGELHIWTKTVIHGELAPLRTMQVEVSLTLLPDELEADGLRRIARDILAKIEPTQRPPGWDKV